MGEGLEVGGRGGKSKESKSGKWTCKFRAIKDTQSESEACRYGRQNWITIHRCKGCLIHPLHAHSHFFLSVSHHSCEIMNLIPLRSFLFIVPLFIPLFHPPPSHRRDLFSFCFFFLFPAFVFPLRFLASLYMSASLFTLSRDGCDVRCTGECFSTSYCSRRLFN